MFSELSTGVEGAGRPCIRANALAAFLAAAVVCVGGMWFAQARGLEPIDDAYISLRYARNWATGGGLVFNDGQLVEGYTNFLMVALEAAAIRCGADPERAMIALGWLSLAALAAVCVFFIQEHVFPDKPLLAAAAGIAICLNPIVICWGASGLEGCLYAALLLAAFASAAGVAGRVRPNLAAVMLVLAGMTRPETPAWAPILAGLILWQTRSLRAAGSFMAIFAFGFGAYFAARALHFGHLFPNTFYAKLDYGNEMIALRGLRYVRGFASAAWPLVVMGGIGACFIRRDSRWASAATTMIMAQTAVVAFEGGDHFAMFRFMLPVLPFLAILALYPAAVMACREWQRPVLANVTAVAGLLAIGGAGWLAGGRVKTDEPDPVRQFQRYLQEVASARQWSELGRWLDASAPADASIATIAVGAIGFHSDRTIIDPHGIVDPVIAHRRQKLGEGYAGHEKFDISHVLAARPSYLLLLNRLTPQPTPESSLESQVWGAFNRAMLADPRLMNGYRYERIRIGGEFLNLHVRRDLPTPGGGLNIVRGGPR